MTRNSRNPVALVKSRFSPQRYYTGPELLFPQTPCSITDPRNRVQKRLSRDQAVIEAAGTGQPCLLDQPQRRKSDETHDFEVALV